jgi:signal transduction histidine kinase
MSGDRGLRTLRRRLFGSHLLVMGVALVVLLIGVGLVALLSEAFGARHSLGRGPNESDAPFGLLVGVGAAAIASALVSWRITQRLAGPLEQISAATKALAAGNYDIEVPGADTVEVDALADDVNQLAHELRTTEERRLRLIGDVAHELRNPLSTIEGTMEALLDGVVAADEETFTRIGREASRLRRLADDLSSLSAAAEFGRFDESDVDLQRMVADVVAQLEPQALATGLDLTFAGQSATVRGDRDRLTQVLMNVVGNAIQYTESGAVAVRMASMPDRVRIEVEDTGRGLAAEDQTRIFERFHRVDEHFSDGTGVGLAISKLIVEAHGGTIVATSTGLGLGTVLRIELPTGGALSGSVQVARPH